ncbi:MAG: RNA 2',3'-cyclic phosphodiesterase, partial [Pseudothermotoga sp.]|nr:RNA 2',3'-cyclic phosphodiesterase [Pseudothermotoga sp.]
MRTFIAIDVNDTVRDVSQQVIEKLMRRGFKANWVS